MTEVGQPRAADPPEPPDGSGVGTHPERGVKIVASTGERRSEVRRSETDQVAEPAEPGVAITPCDFARAAGDQAPHAVTDQRQPVDRHGPARGEPVQQPGEGASVARDVQSGVVPDRENRAAQRAFERGKAVGMPGGSSGVGHAEPVDEDHHPSARLRNDRMEARPFCTDGLTAPAEVHGDRQRARGARQMVADDPVHRGEQPFRPRAEGLRFRGLPQEAEGNGAHDPGHPPDGPIHQPGDPPRSSAARRSEDRRPPRDFMVHGLDHLGETERRVTRQLPPSAGVQGSTLPTTKRSRQFTSAEQGERRQPGVPIFSR